MSIEKTAIIIGAGPAGLTAAYELATRSGIKPIVFEAGSQVGGISKTVNYKGNRIDIGGHRFFSKSDRVMKWWTNILPLDPSSREFGESVELSYQNQRRALSLVEGAEDRTSDDVMLLRPRVSRIFYNRNFFDYPVKANVRTLVGLGPVRSAKIMASYTKARLFPIKPEVTLRDFIINRFGHELYATFFRDYTEKVWGVPCEDIPAEWGAQRIKGLSIAGLIRHAIRKVRDVSTSIDQKDTETSLIERFLYPKLGPGQLWERVAGIVEEHGGEVILNTRVVGVQHRDQQMVSVEIEDHTGKRSKVGGDYFFTSTSIRELIGGWQPAAPAKVATVADGLPYRDFITVGVLLKKLNLSGGATAATLREKVPDNWIYVQEPDVKVGRIQIFNNWSPALVADPDTIWLGLEYFVDEKDRYWSMDDEAFKKFAHRELEKLGFCDRADVIDSCVVRTPKAYPAYFGSYDRFKVVRDYLQKFDNLYCVGRNGMHRYNNQDHSMLTAMVAVDGILAGRDTRAALWEINAEQEYHEEEAGRLNAFVAKTLTPKVAT